MSEAKSSDRFLLLDGMRGLAALGIMVFHLWLTNQRYFLGFNLFVDFFFVLSGFVLSPALMVSTFKKFIFTRILRLYPMLIPVFILSIVVHNVPFISQHVMEASPHRSAVQYLGAFLLLQIFWGALIPVNTPLWSLSAEWFVNLFAAILKSKNKTYVIISIGFLFELIGIYLNHRFDLGWGVISYLIAIGRVIVGFYLGITLRIILSKQEYKSSIKRLIFMLFIFGLNFYLFAFSDYFVISAAPICFFLLREGASVKESYLPKRFLRLCSYLGRISYGIYVWHIPISSLNIPYFLLKHSSIALEGSLKIIFIASITLILVVLVTEASIRFVEIPLRKVAHRRMKESSLSSYSTKT